MKVPSMNDALKANQIDGMLTYDPFVTTAVENGNTELVDSSGVMLTRWTLLSNVDTEVNTKELALLALVDRVFF